MRVLVGVDLTVLDHDWLLDRASRFAERIQATIDLVFVSTAPSKQHEALLTGLLTLIPEGVRGRARVETGDPADGLIALTPEYDVMVIGPREPAALQRWLIGPMAVRVLQRSSCPVLVPRAPKPMPDAPRLLIGLDVHGDALDRTMAFGTEWAGRLHGTLDAVYAIAVTLPSIQNKAMRDAAERQFLAGKEPDRQALVGALAAVPASHRGDALLRTGEPEDVLVHLSESYAMVLVGNRGRTGLTRLLMGNVANHVVRNAHCDVLVLPTTALIEGAKG